MGKELSLLSCIAYTFGILNAVVVVKIRLKLCLDTEERPMKLRVASDRSDSTAAAPASDHRGQGVLCFAFLCLDADICGEMLLFTYRKSIFC